MSIDSIQGFFTWESNLLITYKHLGQAVGSPQVHHQSGFFTQLFIQPIQGYENQIRIPP